MNITVRLGEPLWRVVGAQRLLLSFDQEAVSVADVISRLAADYPAFESSYRQGGWERGIPYNLFVNARQVLRGEEAARLLADGDKVFFFLPAVGGADSSALLPRKFYLRPTLAVARDLLGRRLVRTLDGQRLSGRIVEVEAYVGENDLASHAARGRTDRNRAMYGHGGLAYVYFIYGMHYCLNVVTEREGFPAAVLIRSIEPEEGTEIMQQRRLGQPRTRLTDGPGKLCQALAIDRRLDGHDLTLGQELWLEAGEPIPDERVDVTPRIGVVGDEQARAAPWRFVAHGHAAQEVRRTRRLISPRPKRRAETP